ncbi:gluconokinase [Nocardioides sp. Leaf374]|uniref:gluconokinase n=1 Tax=Nocardioides sp. Leaf374 TaxID=2876560 RepID=UPI001E560031|nr:gluconokinase [Nocardioides sp. Leaf374]
MSGLPLDPAPVEAPRTPLQVVVMGVSATGKSTVARGLADELGWPMVEGDDLHPEANIAKMEAGEPLTDTDREPWLDRIAVALRSDVEAGRPGVVTCSALKRSYRDRLRAGAPNVFFVHLHTDPAVLRERMARRERHFMPTSLLDSQLETLEPLDADEQGAVVDVAPPVEEVVAEAARVVRARLSSS